MGEAVQALLEGDAAGRRATLRDFINATIGFEALGQLTNTPAKSLMRMFGPKGNPTAGNLFSVIGALQKRTGVYLEVRAVSEKCTRSARFENAAWSIVY